MDTVKELFTVVKEAVDAGATGGTIGRNIWQHKDPERMVKALISIIHENKDIEDVLKIVEQ
jgi:class I fructose-bisphosphate aldolase